MYNLYNKSNVVRNLIIINVIAFIFLNLLIFIFEKNGLDYSLIVKNTAINIDFFDNLKRPWVFIFHMFSHFDLLHLVFNMLGFYSFAKILEEKWGSISVINSYIFGGILGSLFFCFLLPFFIDINSGENYYGIGASGGVFSIMVAAAVAYPNKEFYLIFFNIKLKWLVLILFIISNLINFSENTGGKIDHIGGSFFGFFYVYFLNRGNNILNWFDKLFLKNKRKSHIYNKKNKFTFRGTLDKRPYEIRNNIEKQYFKKISQEKELDFLLDKIKKNGYNTLSEEEKNKLIEISKNY
jgi:membrane associated rhomboid family serine protease